MNNNINTFRTDDNSNNIFNCTTRGGFDTKESASTKRGPGKVRTTINSQPQQSALSDEEQIQQNFYGQMENIKEDTQTFHGDPEDYAAWEISRAEKVLENCETYKRKNGVNKKLKRYRKQMKGLYIKLAAFVEEA